MTNKKFLLILVFIIIILIVGYLFRCRLAYYRTQAECRYLNLNHYGIDMARVDCFDIFSIGRSRGIYYFRDDLHKYDIVAFDNQDQYKINNGYIYVYSSVINSDEFRYDRVKYGDEDWQYYRYYYMNGRKEKILYNSPEEFPKYIQVQYGTGETTLYNNYDEMPEEIKSTFQELEDNYNNIKY